MPGRRPKDLWPVFTANAAEVQSVQRGDEMQAGTTVKEKARRLVGSLPDDATWDDLMYAIYVRQSVEEGLADADAGRVSSNEEVRASFGLDGRAPRTRDD